MTLIKAMRQMSGAADSAQPVIKRFVLRITPSPVIRLYEWLKYRGWTEEYRLESMVGALGAWKESRDFQLDFLRQRGLQREHAVLDIGCGLLRGGIPLIQYLDSGKYTGIDIRPEVIEQAQEQLRRHRLNDKMPTVIVSGGFGQGKLDDRSYDYIWCFQVLHVLEDDLVDACLGQVSRVLAQNGSFYADINAIYEEKRWKEFPYVRRRG